MTTNLSAPDLSHEAIAKPIVSLRDVHLHVGTGASQVNILRGLDLQIAAGETVAVVGPSGSGKSTMMMIVGGLQRQTSGSVNIDGHDLSQMSEDALALFRRDRVGIVFQSFHLIPAMTALENVAVPLELAGRPDAYATAERGLDAVGLSHRLTHYPGQLSGGEQQRVAMARAFAPSPTLLLADEPTGNLDHETGAAVMEVLFDLRRINNTTLMLITHDDTVAAGCDRTVRLIDGRIIDDGRQR